MNQKHLSASHPGKTRRAAFADQPPPRLRTAGRPTESREEPTKAQDEVGLRNCSWKKLLRFSLFLYRPGSQGPKRQTRSGTHRAEAGALAALPLTKASFHTIKCPACETSGGASRQRAGACSPTWGSSPRHPSSRRTERWSLPPSPGAVDFTSWMKLVSSAESPPPWPLPSAACPRLHYVAKKVHCRYK